jgi:predicted DnaQ family exonuclease/DinG family helicase
VELIESFVALDLETTGLDPKLETIIEVGLILFEKGKVKENFSATVNPRKTVSDNVLMLTGIKQEELYSSPTLEKIIPDIKDFMADRPLVGHNIAFDISFLERSFPVRNATYDTFTLSRIYLPFASGHGLSNIVEYLKIPYENAHRASQDAEMAGRIFLRISDLMTNLEPELLKKQLDIMDGKYSESELMKRALEISLRKGLNREPYPFEIPVNFRENRGNSTCKNHSSIKEYFDNKILEERHSQLMMAELVQSVLTNGDFLLVESSAGTGKSLAYLVPSILMSRDEKNPIYISSYTKNLQQQLFNQDIPFSEEITGCGVNTVMQKGRSNYLCLKKTKEMPKNLEPISLCSLILWSFLTRTGDLSEISYVFREINKGLISMDESCKKESCPHYKDCFFYNMKKRTKDADLILVNHALFFTGNLNVSKVIFDEAHELEKAATSGFSMSVSFGEIQAVLNNISKDLKKNTKVFKEIKGTVDKAKETFEKIADKALSTSDYQEGFYKDQDISVLSSLQEALKGVASLLSSVELDDEAEKEKLKEIIMKMKVIIEQEEEDRVFYYKVLHRQRLSSIELIAAPLDVAPYLEEFLYPNLDSFVMTSATLTVGESFDFIKNILGLNSFGDRLKEVSLPETYKLKEQALTIIPSYISDPGEAGFIDQVSQFIRDVIIPQERGTLVLFMSYKHMKGVYQQVYGDFEALGRELLIQGFGKSRKKLLTLFKENPASVLFGTGSFWQGIDVPGKSLEIVVIEKLPFPNPSEPLVGAKSAYFEKKGLGGFSYYILPLSVLRFKQGFGRLIRSTRDMGVVFILDSRVLNKSYGSAFLESLPTEISVVRTSLDAQNALKSWFEEGKIYSVFTEDSGWEPF